MYYKKILFVVSVLAIFGFLFNLNIQDTKAMTATELQNLITQLQQQIAALQQQILLLQSQGTTTTAWCHTFNISLKMGDTGAEVVALQAALQKEGIANISTGEFDEETASAVVEFQEKYASEILTPVHLKHGNGFVGKLTRTKLNKLYGCAVIPPTCIQVITPAKNPITNECKNFPTPCDVPSGWTQVASCPSVVKPNLFIYQSMVVDRNKATFMIGNNGNAPATNFLTAVYLRKAAVVASTGISGTSTSSSLGFDYTLQCSYPVSTPFEAGAQKAYTCNYVSQLEPDTTYDVKLATDIGNDVNESNENDNVQYAQLYGSGTITNLIAVTSPNGGETWTAGTTNDITWYSSWSVSPISKVSIYLTDVTYADGAIPLGCVSLPCLFGTYCPPSCLTPIATNISASLDKYSWTIPNNFNITKAKILIEAVGILPKVNDTSDDYFNIVVSKRPSPCNNYGDTTADGYVTKEDVADCQKVIAGILGGDLFKTRCDVNGDGVVNVLDTTQMERYIAGLDSIFPICKIECKTDSDCPQTRCESQDKCYGYTNKCVDGKCVAETTKFITLLSPNGGEQWGIGETHNITWKSSGIDKVGIYLTDVIYEDGTVSVIECEYDPRCESKYCPPCLTSIATNISASLGKYSWTIPSSPKILKAKVYIEATGAFPKIYDRSDNYFSIIRGTDCNQRCKTSGYSLGACKTFSVTPSGFAEEQAFLKYYDKMGETSDCYLPQEMVGVSENCYCYPKKEKSVTLIYPNGGETWTAGTTNDITWYSSLSVSPISKVSIYLTDVTYADGAIPLGCVSLPCLFGTYCPPSCLTPIATNISASLDKYSWTIPNNFNITKAKILIEAVGILPKVNDTSDDYFNIVTANPSITISFNPSADILGNVTIKQGDRITITGLPSNLSGQLGEDYTRAFFFDSIFNGSCSNPDSDTDSHAKWVMTCTANQIGTSYFYITIYKGGQTYKSNVIKVTVIRRELVSFENQLASLSDALVKLMESLKILQR